ncbi:MAG: GAF domain-containing sensor histidine kinase, partial [Anaerolineae bacterium]|nr:GAF domain-containing sensor histidine kinase [Anaerolineae bacterium]
MKKNRAVSAQKKIETLQTKVAKLEFDFQEAQNRIADLCVVQEVAQSLTFELNLDPLLHKILASAVDVMHASAGSLLLLDELTNELVFEVVEGGGGEKLRGVRIPRGKGISGWVAANRKPIIVDDVNKDDRYYQSVAQSFDFPLTSLLCVPMISHNRLIGVIQVVHSKSGTYFGPLDQQLLTTFANQAAIAIENARLYESLKEERDRLVVVENDVRKRLARDLHDGPTQLLASVVMSLDFIKEAIDKSPDLAVKEVNLAATVGKKALKQLRTLLFNLRPVILETQGLIPALETYVEQLRETEKFDVVLTITAPFARLTPQAEVAIFAVVQEAINNAKKYANASKIELVLSPHSNEDELIVVIKDDGNGFDVSKIKEGYDERGSLG